MPSSPQPLFLFKLSPTIPQPYLVKLLCRLPTAPTTSPDPSDPTFPFIEIDSATKSAVQSFLASKSAPGLIIPLPFPAAKILTGRLALGHKMQVPPQQDEYPVPYFLYGDLAKVDTLVEVCDMVREPFVVDAEVKDGEVKYWKGERKALVDGEGARVEGKMYVVKNREEEDMLREYVGSHFEVVRCVMRFVAGGQGYLMRGLTFRYCGPEQHLMDEMC